MLRIPFKTGCSFHIAVLDWQPRDAGSRMYAKGRMFYGVRYAMGAVTTRAGASSDIAIIISTEPIVLC